MRKEVLGYCVDFARTLTTLDNKICELIHEADKVRKQKTVMEFQMEKIGINCEKIQRATSILKDDRGYVRTGEREKHDEELEKKRKADEELREQEEK